MWIALPIWVSQLPRKCRRLSLTKKADVTRDASVSGHVGLLHNRPPRAIGLPFVSSSNVHAEHSNVMRAESNLNDFELRTCTASFSTCGPRLPCRLPPH